ncbi:hypothetical protein PVAND_005932 [Polypedilum vanderplanki]|uniref:Core Histone H2A/H2B/H3 domain-containing protein n=1 Tax=Polypedilum vanderplanki TaxID=319348 RepID=A0A9J6C3H5_POLVA|nr:hypothetical protein PVAND_005932 [Polypedilum vanderplanki]
MLSESEQSTIESNAESPPQRSSQRKNPQKQQSQEQSTSKNSQSTQSKKQQKDVSSKNQRKQAEPQQREVQEKGKNNKTDKRKKQYPLHIKEIMRLQKSTENQIPKLPFTRLLKEILQKHGDFRMQSTAVAAIQEATELYFVQLFDDAYKLTLHRQRVTLHSSDISLVLYIRGQTDPGVR